MRNSQLASGLFVTQVANEAEPENFLIDERHARHYFFNVLPRFVCDGGVFWAEGTVEKFSVRVEWIPATALFCASPIEG